MAIPDDHIIQEELLELLASSPGGRLNVRSIYSQLANLHPELTDQEKNQQYENSLSKWANRVQFARLHLVQSGLLFRADAGPNPARGVWIITEKGRKWSEEKRRQRNIASLENLEKTAAADLESQAYEDEYPEGKQIQRLSSFHERNPKLRAAAIAFHGQICKACGFDFQKKYGEHGAGYIEVHHLTPISTFSKETNVDPKTEMTVLCSNCHRMIHRKKELPLSPEDLRGILQ